jgi:hypothetical protein
MRNWINIINEGEVVNLAQHKTAKTVGAYVDALAPIFQGEAEFFASGKFLPFAKAYIDSGYSKEYAPEFYVQVSFRDHRLTPAAKDVLSDLRARKFKIDRTKYHKEFTGTKEGPWAQKIVSFEEAREFFLARDHSPFGAYQPSRSGFRSSRVENYDENGVGFNVSVLGMDYRRPGKYSSQPHRQEDHVVDNDKDWQEVADMMATIKRSHMK